jgi:hypothetical protein
MASAYHPSPTTTCHTLFNPRIRANRLRSSAGCLIESSAVLNVQRKIEGVDVGSRADYECARSS